MVYFADCVHHVRHHRGTLICTKGCHHNGEQTAPSDMLHLDYWLTCCSPPSLRVLLLAIGVILAAMVLVKHICMSAM